MAERRSRLGDDVEMIPVRLLDGEESDPGDAADPDDTSLPILGPEDGAPARGRVAIPRLARHEIELSDGHRVGVAVSGRGVPLVVVHGFSAEGFLYAQSLSRLVSMGFKVVAIDTAGHGGTQGLPAGGRNFESYTRLLGRAMDELGIRRAILAGHSMGGRLVTQLAAHEPDRAIAVVLVDAIVGRTWDRLVNVLRIVPPTAVGIGVALAVDSLATVPLFKDRRQTAKLLRLVAPTLVGHARRPWRLLGPGVSIARSRGSRWMLQRLAQEQVPVYAIHGDRDMVVPLQTARDAAESSRGHLVVVKGGTHSWVLRDPEVLPGIIAELLDGPLGEVYRDAVGAQGLDLDTATIDEVDAAFCVPGSRICELTPPLEFVGTTRRRRRPKLRWTIEAPPA